MNTLLYKSVKKSLILELTGATTTGAEMTPPIKTVIILISFSLFSISCTEVEMRRMSQQVMSSMTSPASAPLSYKEMDSGLREALRIGSERVIGQVGVENGYYRDNNIHIPLPRSIEKADQFARKVGLDKTFRELEKKMNRAAEQAAPRAKALFVKAIKEMTLGDVKQILNGADDAATRYFETKMTPQLVIAMRPIVDESLNQVGAVRLYNDLARQLQAIPFAPKIDTDLNGYVIKKGIDGLFYYLAREEAAIRNNPVKRTTAILKRVFGR
jgi:hypothetical protein